MDRDGPKRECARCEHDAPEKFGREVDEGWLCLICLDRYEEEQGIK